MLRLVFDTTASLNYRISGLCHDRRGCHRESERVGGANQDFQRLSFLMPDICLQSCGKVS